MIYLSKCTFERDFRLTFDVFPSSFVANTSLSFDPPRPGTAFPCAIETLKRKLKWPPVTFVTFKRGCVEINCGHDKRVRVTAL